MFVSAAASASAASLDPNFSESDFIINTGLNETTGIAWAPDGSNRLFVIRKGGQVRIVQYNNGQPPTGTLLATPFATETVFTNSECGLIGMWFDPNFVNNQFVYFFVTASASEQQIIRYTASGNVGINRTLIVGGLPTAGNNHDGGFVGIGPDGKLYWAIGDLGNGTGVDADLNSLAAKVGRADRFTGQPVNSNPFFDSAGPNNDHIWARGFRNPFTGMFSPRTGKLWINCVGTNYEQIFVVNAGEHAGYNDYENNQPSGFLAPIIVYRTNGTDTRTITATGAVRSGGVSTFTTTGNHGFRKGGKITVSGVGNASFNGDFFVASVPSLNTFTVSQPALPNANSGGGTAVTLNIGGSMTGGCFYDGTAFPAAYHHNFFFGDYNSGRLERVVLDPNESIVSVDHFVTGNNGHVDTATGPDGALYYASVYTNVIKRLATNSTAQNVIVQPTAFYITEGGDGVFTVRLAAAPIANVTVNVAKLGGDSDVTLVTNSTLTFTPSNWNQLQSVKIHPATDSDFANDSATFRISSSGLTSYDVLVNVIDADETNLHISAANVPIVEGGTRTFTVRLAQQPGAPVNVTVARTSGSTDLTVTGGASLSFQPDHWNVPQTVTLAAAEDADNTNESAVVSVTIAGSPPRTVNVPITDNDGANPVITTTPITKGVLNNPYSYDVNAVGNPAPTFSLPTAPAGMTINTSTGLISWTPTSTGAFNVVVRASNGAQTDQSYTLTISPDAPPTASLTRPVANETLSGTTAEFFGDGLDDVATVRGEFFVDGVLHYTDTASGGHYHFGGAHLLFDTTQFSNGPHTFRLRVVDTNNASDFKEVQGLIANGYAAWKTQKFTPAEQADPSISGLVADPDADRFSNLYEYSADSEPKLADVMRAPVPRIVEVNGNEYLALEFVVAKWATDLTRRVEVNGDLNLPWTQIDPANPQYQVSVLDNTPAYGLATYTIRDTTPVQQNTVRFIRLRVSQP
jgi:glucose/arabinose dehydrogenase